MKKNKTILKQGKRKTQNPDGFYSIPKLAKEAKLVLKLPKVYSVGLIQSLTSKIILDPNKNTKYRPR